MTGNLVDSFVEVKTIVKKPFANLKDNLDFEYFPLTGIEKTVQQKLLDKNLISAGMENGRIVFHNLEKTFLTYSFAKLELLFSQKSTILHLPNLHHYLHSDHQFVLIMTSSSFIKIPSAPAASSVVSSFTTLSSSAISSISSSTIP